MKYQRSERFLAEYGRLSEEEPELVRWAVRQINRASAIIGSSKNCNGFLSLMSRNLYPLMMQDQQLVGAQGQRRIGATLVVAELDLEDLGRQRLDDGSYLSAAQTILGQILEQRDDIKYAYRGVHRCFPLSRD